MARFRQRLRRSGPGEAGSDEADTTAATEHQAAAASAGGDDPTIIVDSEFESPTTEDGGADQAVLDQDADAAASESVSSLRRERAVLVDRYTEASADLGGLVIEMARRQDFRMPLIEQRAASAAALEDAIASIDGRIAAVRDRRRTPPRPAALTAERVCGQCGGLIAADANFCGYCGTARPADD